VNAIEAAIADRFSDAAASKFHRLVSSGSYNLMWDLTKSDIAAV
jgi:hypothetical protein